MDGSSRIAEMLTSLEEDHNRLRKLGGRILKAIAANDVADVSKTLLELQVAQVNHFRFEERLMAEAEYPGRAEHSAHHERLIATLGAINGALGIGRLSRVSADLAGFIEDSMNHVAEIDETFRVFLDDLLASGNR